MSLTLLRLRPSPRGRYEYMIGFPALAVNCGSVYNYAEKIGLLCMIPTTLPPVTP